MKIRHNNISGQTGAAMIEALIAILIFAIGVLGLLATQATGIQATSDVRNRAEATTIATEIAGDMWAAPPTSPATLDSLYSGTYSASSNDTHTWSLRVSSLLPNGSTIVSVPDTTGAPDAVRIVVNWRVPGQDSHSYTMDTRINGVD